MSYKQYLIQRGFWWVFGAFLFVCWWSISNNLLAQNDASTTVEVRQFDQNNWKKITRDIDYSDEKPPVSSQGNASSMELDWEDFRGLDNGEANGSRQKRRGGGRQKTPSENYVSESELDLPEVNAAVFEPSAIFTQIVKIIGIVLIALALGTLIYWIVRENLLQRNKKVTTTRNVQLLQRLEDNLPESELEKLLRKVLEKGDYQLAIRIHYLIIIRRLSEIKWIKWRKNKTNAHYANELRTKDIYTTFRELTLVFEQIWYGDKTLDHADYQRLAPSFSDFVGSLKNK